MRLPALGIGLAALALGGPALAQGCPAIAGGAAWLREMPVETRLAYIQSRVRRSASRARTWTWAFRSIFSLGVGELALVPAARTGDLRAEAYFGAGKAAIGLASTFVLPYAVMSDQPALDARIARAGAVDCRLLADAERVLVRDAQNELDGQSVSLHLAGLALNLGVGLILGSGYHGGGTAVLGAVGGSAVGELHLLTAPTDLVGALRRYRAGDLFTSPDAARPRWSASVAPVLGGGSYGLGLSVAFE